MSKTEIKPLSKEDRAYAKALIEKLDGTIRRVVRSNLDFDLSSEYEDIVQSIYEDICLQLDDFKTYKSQEALVKTIAERRVWRIQRDRKPTEVLSEEMSVAEDDHGLEDILPPSTSDADREILTAVYECMDTMEKLSEDLGCSAATLRQRLKRARDRLKKAIEK